MRRSRLLIVLLSLPLLLLAGTTAVRAQTTSTVNIESATLVAKGAAAQVVFTGTCDAGEIGVFGATVTQAVGNKVAQGTGFVVLTCTGEPQEATVLVTANVNGARFHVGDALVSASIIFGCCTSVGTSETVRIAR
jgi:hypothetical protein